MMREAGSMLLPNTGEPLKIRVGMHSGPVVRFDLYRMRSIRPIQYVASFCWLPSIDIVDIIRLAAQFFEKKHPLLGRPPSGS